MAPGPTLTDDDFRDSPPALSDRDFLSPDEGSVFSRAGTLGEKARAVGEKARAVGRVTAPIAASYAPLLAGSAAGGAIGSAVGGPLAPVTGPVGAVIGAGIGGAVSPSAGRLMSSFMSGQPYQPPTTRDIARSAIENAVWTGLGEVAGPLIRRAQVADEIPAELQKLPRGQRTMANLKRIRQAVQQRSDEGAAVSAQDLRNRDFWKAHGLNDQQINEVISSPDTQRELARSITQANKTKAAFQTVRDTAKEDFAQRYNTLLGPHASTKIDAVPIGQQFEAMAQSGGQHELTPTFRGFLQRKGLELTKAGEATGPSVGGVPWKHLPESLKTQIRAQGGGQGVKAPSNDLSLDDLRNLRTELNENLPSNATNLDRKAFAQLKQHLTQSEEATLQQAGASPEKIAALHDLDSEYGRFAETFRTLDPRSEKFGREVGNALYDPMVKNPGMALNFIRAARAADDLKPGVMADLRESFVDKALTEARVPGQPGEELKQLRRLQDKWGGDRQARAVMGEMFGKDSPLANPATFTKVVDAGSNPAPIIKKAQQEGGYNILHSPYMQGMITYGALSGLIVSGGSPSGLWQAISGGKGPESQALAIGSILLGPIAIKAVTRSGNSPLQRAMVGFMTKPSYANTVRYTTRLAGALGTGIGNLPSPQQIAENPSGGSDAP